MSSRHIFNPGPSRAADFHKKWVRPCHLATCECKLQMKRL